MCITAVGVVTDLCRAFEGEFKHLMPEIMVIFVENLSVSSGDNFVVNPSWQLKAVGHTHCYFTRIFI